MTRRCPYCNSIWVCWNWLHSFAGDLDAYAKANPHMTREELAQTMWGHECWDCDSVHQTEGKVNNGIPYRFLKRCYKFFRKAYMNYAQDFQVTYEQWRVNR